MRVGCRRARQEAGFEGRHFGESQGECHLNCREFESDSASHDIWWSEARLGKTYYQPQGLDGETVDATVWIVLFYLPLYPVRRVRLKRVGRGWRQVGTRPRNLASVLLLYLSAYLFIPALVALPVVPFCKWFQSVVSMPMPVRVVGILCWLVFLVAVANKAIDRHEDSLERATRNLTQAT